MINDHTSSWKSWHKLKNLSLHTNQKLMKSSLFAIKKAQWNTEQKSLSIPQIGQLVLEILFHKSLCS